MSTVIKYDGKKFVAEKFVKAKNDFITEQHKKLIMEAANIAQKRLLNICGLYRKIRPVLIVAKKVLFFKPKLSKTIGDLIVLLDESCPV